MASHTTRQSKALQNDGWQAKLKLGFGRIGKRTVLTRRERKGPLAVQRPFYPEGDICHVYLLHPPGGVVGGDKLNIAVQLQNDCHTLITTPGATKFYRSNSIQARQVQNLELAHNACLEWFPQENIFFPGATVSMCTKVDLTSDARIAMWEIHCFGRPTIQEKFSEGCIDSRFELYRDGRPLLLERLTVNTQQENYLSTLQHKPVCATLVMSNANEQALDSARHFLSSDTHTHNHNYSAATLIDDLLIVRYLGDSTEQARNLFSQIWSELRLILIGIPANMPRIWNT